MGEEWPSLKVDKKVAAAVVIAIAIAITIS